MRMLRVAFIVSFLLPMVGGLASAQAPQPAPSDSGSAAAIIRTLFASKDVDGSLFASSFTAHVPVATLQTIVDRYRTRLGAFRSVEPAGTDYAALFDHGSVLASVTLDGSGKIAGLLFHDEVSSAVRSALERFLAAKTISADWFAPAFLAQVPAAQIQSLVDQVAAQEGAYVRLDERGRRYVAVFEKAENPALGSLDEAGRFEAIFLGPPTLRK